MADEKTQFWIWGVIIATVTGLYGFFIRHVVKHPERDEINSQIQKLWDEKQSTRTCEQIVNRLDENHKETSRKLDRVLEYLEEGGPRGRVRT